MSADLLVPLSELSGFDPGGLEVRDNLLGHARRVLCSEGNTLVWWNPERQTIVWWNPERQTMDRVERVRASADLADSATRDRLARWLAARLDLEIGCTAPTWEWWDLDRKVWRLSGEATRTFDPADVPGLAEIEVGDDDLLPDGSLPVDAVALGIVARSVGRPNNDPETS